MRNARYYPCGIQVPEGPYQVYVSPSELGTIIGVSKRSIEIWQRKKRLPEPHLQQPNDTKTGRGTGRRFVKFDLWRTLQWLEGKRD